MPETEQDIRPTIVVLVPVRNEAWILKTFLECASLWADHIIIADQLSTDGSAEIAAAFPKVTTIQNPSSEYNEVERQRLLIDAARRLPSPRVLIAIDADEIVSSNILSSTEWETAIRQPPGTILCFAKVELYGSTEEYFLHSVEDKNAWIPFAYVDDETPHEGKVIHTTRVPERINAPHFNLNEVVVLHFTRFNEHRARSKERWYRCFERISFPQKNIFTIHHAYDFFERLKDKFKVGRTSPYWFSNYETAGIDFNLSRSDTIFWWDWEILRFFKKHGTQPFRYLDIWSVDWERLRLQGLSQGIPGLPDQPIDVPMSLRDRLIRAGLRGKRARGLVDRVMQRVFRYGII